MLKNCIEVTGKRVVAAAVAASQKDIHAVGRENGWRTVGVLNNGTIAMRRGQGLGMQDIYILPDSARETYGDFAVRRTECLVLIADAKYMAMTKRRARR